MTKPISPGLLLHRLLTLLSWKHKSSILAQEQEKVSSLSPLPSSMFREASKMTTPKETAAALKAACSHRPRITRNPWWSMAYQEYQLIFIILQCPITTFTFPGKEIEKETADQTLYHLTSSNISISFLAVYKQRQCCPFWWISYYLATDGKQMSILTHLIASAPKIHEVVPS